jgi:hypothetical protein
LAVRVTFDRAAVHLRTILETVTDKAKVVVTSRPQHFINDKQIKTALGEQVDQVAGRRIVRLLPFGPEQVKEFLVNRLKGETLAAARFELIDQIKDLMGLSETPRMLGFIADLPQEDLLKAKANDGEITASKLYRSLLAACRT